jgi:hypothetical protein
MLAITTVSHTLNLLFPYKTTRCAVSYQTSVPVKMRVGIITCGVVPDELVSQFGTCVGGLHFLAVACGMTVSQVSPDD